MHILVCHQTSHTGERPSQCNICDKELWTNYASYYTFEIIMGIYGMNKVIIIAFTELSKPMNYINSSWRYMREGDILRSSLIVYSNNVLFCDTEKSASVIHNGRNLIYVFIVIQNGNRLVIFLSIIGNKGEKLFSLSFMW